MSSTPSPATSTPATPRPLSMTFPSSERLLPSTLVKGSSAPPSPTTEPGPISWPDPAAASRSPIRSTSISHTLSPRRRNGPFLSKPPLQRYEVALVDRLAVFLEGAIEGIQQASGAKCKLVGEAGARKFQATGSSSAVTKAADLVAARLSQTPIRVLLAIRFPPSPLATVQLRLAPSPAYIPPSTSSHPDNFYRLVTSPFLTPSSFAPQITSPTGSETFVGNPGTEISDTSTSTSFFTAASRSVSRISLLGDIPHSLPSIGSYSSHFEAYIETVVDELSTAAHRRSLVRLKLMPGVQTFLGPSTTSGQNLIVDGTTSWDINEIESWQLEGPDRKILPHFSLSLSRSTTDSFKQHLTESFYLKLSHETSVIHVSHLDRRRAVFAVASAELRGGELKDITPGTSASGTISLKKVSTLARKPYFLSISEPTKEGEEFGDGTDLRIKVLTDKAATSPSLELSNSFNRGASWDLDSFGNFNVHLELDPERFTASQTEIRWVAKSRYENEKFRATICEVRPNASSSHWFEVEFASLVLNSYLAEVAQSGRKVDREKVSLLVEELIEFGLSVIHRESEGEGGSAEGSEVTAETLGEEEVRKQWSDYEEEGEGESLTV